MTLDKKTEIVTKKELLIKIHDEILERIVRNEIDLIYFRGWANKFKKGDPNRDSNIQSAAMAEQNLSKDKFLLPIILEKIKGGKS